MKLRIFMIGAMALAVACFSSCNTVLEDMDDCPPNYNVRILVKLEAEDLGLDPLPGYDIQTVRVYVFDAEGIFVTVWEGGPYTPGEEYEVPLHLPPGDYTFVAWTNLHEEMYGVSHASAALEGKHMDEIGILGNLPQNRIITDDLPDLLHGTKEADIANNRDALITILIKPVIYRVTFVVTGLPDNEDEYGFIVGDSDFRLNFENRIEHYAQALGFSYRRSAYFTEGAEGPELKVSMMIVGLTDDPDRIPPTFVFRDNNTGELLYPHGGAAEANLIEMIIQTYKAQHNGEAPDFGRTFEFLVPLHFTAGLGVELDLRPWFYLEDEWIIG